MIAGHFGLAAIVKARATSVPLWALMLGCQILDVVFVPLVVAGVERFEPIAGATAGGYGELIIHADYTHSLVGAVLLSVLFGGLLGLRYGRRAAIVLGLVAFSHWPLDLLMHRHDMPLLPGGPPSFGLGLWRWQGVSAALELALVVAGAVLYWRAARDVSAGRSTLRRANVCGAAMLGFGVLTLGLNLAGM